MMMAEPLVEEGHDVEALKALVLEDRGSIFGEHFQQL